MNKNFRRVVLAVAASASLSGCMSLAPRASGEHINTPLAALQGPALAWSAVNQPAGERQAIDQWLAAPMTAESAVRVAMLRSPRLQQEYARLGPARAEVLEAVQTGNPPRQKQVLRRSSAALIITTFFWPRFPTFKGLLPWHS